jgi:ABC-2 type transport system permease protein
VHGAALPFARGGLRGTVAARFWLYQRREPGSLIYWGLIAVIMVAASVSTIRTPSYLGALLGSAGFGAAFIGVFHANSIGMTGPAFGVEAMALSGRRALRGYFSGQNVALAIIAVPLLTAISFGLAAVAGHPADGFLGMAVDLAGIGAGLALSNLLTVALPYPAEKRAGNPTPRAADGYMGRAIAGVFGCLFGVAVAVTPVVLAAVLTRHDPAGARIPLLLVCAAGYGLVLAWAGVRVAALAAAPRLPELYQIAGRSKL